MVNNGPRDSPEDLLLVDSKTRLRSSRTRLRSSRTRLRFRRRDFEVALCPLRPTIDVIWPRLYNEREFRSHRVNGPAPTTNHANRGFSYAETWFKDSVSVLIYVRHEPSDVGSAYDCNASAHVEGKVFLPYFPMTRKLMTSCSVTQYSKQGNRVPAVHQSGTKSP